MIWRSSRRRVWQIVAVLPCIYMHTTEPTMLRGAGVAVCPQAKTLNKFSVVVRW